MKNNHTEHNASGYIDETVDAVIKKEYNAKEVAKENYKYKDMSKHIKDLLDANGYILDGPISLINIDSGRKRRIY